MRFETVDNENAIHMFRDIFEIMLDGFAPPSDIVYMVGGSHRYLLRPLLLLPMIPALILNAICYVPVKA